MTLLAIGATGFIGPHVVRQLIQQNHDVTVFHRGETTADLPDAVRSIHGNRNTLAKHRATFERLAPDVVIDLVAISSSDVYRNYDGWRGVSDHAPDPVPLGENAPLRDTLYPYRGYEELDFAYADDYDKILVERTVMGADSLASTVLRLPAVYGPGNAQHRLAPHLRRMDDGRPALLMDARQARWRWTHGYVENVAAAIAHAVTDERATGQVVNVGEATTPTAAGRVEALGRAALSCRGSAPHRPADAEPPLRCGRVCREWERAQRRREYAAEDAALRQAC